MASKQSSAILLKATLVSEIPEVAGLSLVKGIVSIRGSVTEI